MGSYGQLRFYTSHNHYLALYLFNRPVRDHNEHHESDKKVGNHISESLSLSTEHSGQGTMYPFFSTFPIPSHTLHSSIKFHEACKSRKSREQGTELQEWVDGTLSSIPSPLLSTFVKKDFELSSGRAFRGLKTQPSLL